MEPTQHRKVCILVNRRSGVTWSFEDLERAFARHWDTESDDVSYQFCHNPEDGRRKGRRAAEQGVDILFVCGGDGTVSSVGSSLIGTDTALAVIPMGSGNGFARHFGIPLKPAEAIRALAAGSIQRIDVGTANGDPFLVTCGMAWDAALVRTFDKSPVRGILPYIFAGVREFLDYKPQEITAVLDSGEVLTFPDPMVFTVANLSQYGGDTIIAPDAKADDGMLELVVACRQDAPILFANIPRLFNGSISELPRVLFRRFRSLTARRAAPACIQVDGELRDAPAKIEIRLFGRALNVLVPPNPRGMS